MRLKTTILSLLAVAVTALAQEIKTYDLVKLTDGRVIKGEIILFDGTDGDLTIVDPAGRKFFLTAQDYEYFVEDQAYRVRNRDTVIVKERRTEGWQVSVGTSIAMFNWRPNLIEDDYFLNAPDVVNDIPVSLKAGFGQYRGREHYLGAQVEIGLLLESVNYLNAGFRYQHQYDGYKRNLALYVPIDLYFNRWSGYTNYSVNDSNPPAPFPFETGDENIKNVVSSLGIGIGQGFAFVLENKKTISLELGIFKNFVLNQSYPEWNAAEPNEDIQIDGFKFALTYNL
ncbi:MAG: hypothetical protein JXR19_00320 [Bacteroidia bacterium]